MHSTGAVGGAHQLGQATVHSFVHWLDVRLPLPNVCVISSGVLAPAQSEFTPV
jgi:hypothetical protein